MGLVLGCTGDHTDRQSFLSLSVFSFFFFFFYSVLSLSSRFSHLQSPPPAKMLLMVHFPFAHVSSSLASPGDVYFVTKAP